MLKDRYRAIAPLGEGGFGRTFLAEDADRLKAACVIKQFLPVPEIQGNSAAMQKATQLFEQEGRQLLQLGEQHPQIPSLFAYFEQDKRLYLVQQYIEGQQLGQNLERQEAFSEEQLRDLLNDLLPVLQFVHEHQVIHRDIKPTNIIKRKRWLLFRPYQHSFIPLKFFNKLQDLFPFKTFGELTKMGGKRYSLPIQRLKVSRSLYDASEIAFPCLDRARLRFPQQAEGTLDLQHPSVELIDG